jgi:excisionase family DNA binding protein
MANETNHENSTNHLLKATDVASRLNISKALAYQLMATGELPTVRIRNKLVRVCEADLEQFIINSRSHYGYVFPFDATMDKRTLTTE